jgi:hypothetical protein
MAAEPEEFKWRIKQQRRHLKKRERFIFEEKLRNIA